MTLPAAILQIGQATLAAVSFAVVLAAILHFTAPGDAARGSNTQAAGISH